jgi:hypothetical protein
LALNEWLGCATALLLASGLVIGLLWISGSDRGTPPRRLRAMLLHLTGMLAASVAGLVAARFLVGGAVFDLNASSAMPFTARHLSALQWTWLALAAGWACTWGTLAVRLARRITDGTHPAKSVD